MFQTWVTMEKNHPTMHVFSLIILLLSTGLSKDVAMAQNTTISVNVGVVLDFSTLVGKIGLSCIEMAVEDFYASHGHYRTRLVLHARDSKGDVVDAADAARDLIKNVQVQAILGPETTMEASFIIHLGNKSQVPIITFSATSPSLAAINSSYFIRATQVSSSQVKAIGAIVQAYEWREAVPIYIDNEYGQGIIPFLIDALHEVGTHVPNRSVIASSASDDQISNELYKLMTMQTRVFILHMTPHLASKLVLIANKIGMMDQGYVWIMTDGTANFLNCLEPSVIDSLQGALGVTPYVAQSTELKGLTLRWKRKFLKDYPNITASELSIYGLWAYDATRALAMAVERVGTTNFGETNSTSNLASMETYAISQTGPKLVQALSSTRFKGLAGDFKLVNRELPTPAFRVVNVVGNGGRTVGFWTPEKGLMREMNSTNSTSKYNLRGVIWPGDDTSIPKGWEIPTNGRRLRIGVPVKDGYEEFINVTVDPTTNRTEVKGFCIDVFDEVIKALPYAVRYDYVPFRKPDGDSAGSYNDLIYQVHLKRYDAVVGDLTILANRSQYVDFTLPYTESGVSMIVPIKNDRERNAWVFLKPLTGDLWAASACFFIFIGFAIWVLEHRINEDFRGPPSYQVGTSFWFSFSTMVFAHRERVVSNLGRFVVIIWAFVVLILTQSYTASLTSMLTVQQLQPTFSDLSELVKKGENVGYLKDSFVFDILKQYTFDESKLIMYNSTDECNRLLSLGTLKGGVAAAVDETPYMKLFLAKYCSNYTIVQQISKTGGFGFVFPKGSPMVPDISRAVLQVTEGPVMENLEKKWLRKEPTCLGSLSSSPSSNSLGLESFWGLFLIVGVAASVALVLYAAMFLHEHKDAFMQHDPHAPLWKRIGVLFRRFDEKDLTSHTFRKSEVQSTIEMSSPYMGSTQASPNVYCPSSYSTHVDSSPGPEVMVPAVALDT